LLVLSPYDEPLVVSGRTIGSATRAELSLIRSVLRIEARDGEAGNANAHRGEVRNVKACGLETYGIEITVGELSALLEASSVLNLDDDANRLSEIIRHRSAYSLNLVAAPTKNCSDGFRALRYLSVLRWMNSRYTPKDKITPETLLDLHSRITTGRSHHQSGAKFRKEYLIRPVISLEVNSMVAHTERIYSSLSNLCDFLNEDQYSPLLQAVFGCIQLEKIQPFEEDAVQTTALLYHTVLMKRNMTRGSIVPLSLLGAFNPKLHEDLSQAVSSEKASVEDRAYHLNKWINFCSGAAVLASQAVNALYDSVELLIESWRVKVGSVSRGSALEDILHILPTNPLISVESITEKTGKGFSAVNDAVARLTQAKVLTLMPDHRKPRIFEAPEAFSFYDSIMKKALPQYCLNAAFRKGFIE
jgi:hypothetical protein